MKAKPVPKKNSKTNSNLTKNLRKWILKATSTVDNPTGASLIQIKKFLETKEEGLSKMPEIPTMMKNLLESGHIVKVDRRYAAKMPAKPKVPTGKSASNPVVKRNKIGKATSVGKVKSDTNKSEKKKSSSGVKSASEIIADDSQEGAAS